MWMGNSNGSKKASINSPKKRKWGVRDGDKDIKDSELEGWGLNKRRCIMYISVGWWIYT